MYLNPVFFLYFSWLLASANPQFAAILLITLHVSVSMGFDFNTTFSSFSSSLKIKGHKTKEQLNKIMYLGKMTHKSIDRMLFRQVAQRSTKINSKSK